MENACYQNILTNTCKNEPGKPVFIRGSRGYCRNEISPLRALTPYGNRNDDSPGSHSRKEISPLRALTPSVSLLRASTMVEGRNEISPLRALTHSLEEG